MVTKMIKHVQVLNRMLAALGRFLAKSVEQTLPFYRMLKRVMGKKDFKWTEEVEATL